jgi:hypothetical protein
MRIAVALLLLTAAVLGAAATGPTAARSEILMPIEAPLAQ